MIVAMEFRHLTYFVAVAELLHFRKAAELLHIAQPALSQQIVKLERELGVTLLTRTSRSVELTDAGRLFLDDARRLLDLRDKAVQAVKNRADGTSGTLRIAYVGPAAYSVLHVVIGAYRKARPDVDLRLIELTNTEQLDALSSGTLDVGIGRLPIRDPRFTTRPIFTEPVVVMLPANHRFAARDAAVPLISLADEDFIIVPRARESSVFDRYVSLCHEAGFTPRITHEAPLVHTHVEMVAAGMGVALAPASVKAIRRPGVIYRQISAEAEPTVTTGLVWISKNPNPAVAGFIETAATALLPVESD